MDRLFLFFCAPPNSVFPSAHETPLHLWGIRSTSFTLVSISGLHDILGNAARHVRTAAVHLRGVFARQCSATDPADAAVGVTRQFSAGHATVGVRASDNKSAGRVDQLLEVPVQTVLTSGQYHHGFDDMAEIADLHIGAVLYRAEEGGNAAGIVVEADLRFGIGAEHLAGMVFKQFQKPGRYHEGKRHHLRSLVGGIAVHDAL